MKKAKAAIAKARLSRLVAAWVGFVGEYGSNGRRANLIKRSLANINRRNEVAAMDAWISFVEEFGKKGRRTRLIQKCRAKLIGVRLGAAFRGWEDSYKKARVNKKKIARAVRNRARKAPNRFRVKLIYTISWNLPTWLRGVLPQVVKLQNKELAASMGGWIGNYQTNRRQKYIVRKALKRIQNRHLSMALEAMIGKVAGGKRLKKAAAHLKKRCLKIVVFSTCQPASEHP